MTDEDRIRRVKEKHAAQLLGKANVVGVAIGYKEKGGQKTDKPSLVVMVKKKVPLSDLKKQDVVPPEVEGVTTDVQEVGEIKAL